jgi:uncharacterized RmlC-like cupin family protein
VISKIQLAKVAGISTQTLLAHIRLLETVIIDPQANSNTHSDKTKTEKYLKWL